MKIDHSFSTINVSPEYAGLWIAWDRDQKRMVGSGHTFEEAKQAAADAGESSVILAKAPAKSLLRRARRWSQVVAVFISLVPTMSSSLAQGIDEVSQTGVAPITSTMPDDDVANDSDQGLG